MRTEEEFGEVEVVEMLGEIEEFEEESKSCDIFSTSQYVNCQILLVHETKKKLLSWAGIQDLCLALICDWDANNI